MTIYTYPTRRIEEVKRLAGAAMKVVMNNINRNNRDDNRAEVPTVLDHAKKNSSLLRRFRIVAKSVCSVFAMSLSVCPSVRLCQRCSHWTDIRKICYLELVLKSVEKLQILL